MLSIFVITLYYSYLYATNILQVYSISKFFFKLYIYITNTFPSKWQIECLIFLISHYDLRFQLAKWAWCLLGFETCNRLYGSTTACSRNIPCDYISAFSPLSKHKGNRAFSERTFWTVSFIQLHEDQIKSLIKRCMI